jgi:orotate phosphoribosyltransferase
MQNDAVTHISTKNCNESGQPVLSDGSEKFEGNVCNPYQESFLDSDDGTDGQFHPVVGEKCGLIRELHAIGAIAFGSFTLKSGIVSPIYIDLRLIISSPALLQQISDAMWEKIKDLPKDLLCGVPYTALPIATAISLKHGIPMVMRRKEKKEYGMKKTIEGIFHPGQTCLIVEDLVTSGLSVFETIHPLIDEKIHVRDVVVLLDREQGAKERLNAQGYRLHSAFTLSELLVSLESQGIIESSTVEDVHRFIKNNNFAAAGSIK